MGYDEKADYVFISAMAVQKTSAMEVIRRCKKLGIKVVAGGPLFTTGYEEFMEKYVSMCIQYSRGCPFNLMTSPFGGIKPA